MACFGQVAIEPGATGTGFIAKDEVYGLGWHRAEQLIEVTLSGTDGAERGHLSAVLLRHGSHGHRICVDIQTDIPRGRRCHG
jgi:hypothetical protein